MFIHDRILIIIELKYNKKKIWKLDWFLFPVADLENAPKATTSTKTRAPSPPTIRVGHNRLDAQYVSQSIDTTTTSAPVSSAVNDTVRSTISTGSFDYLRGPRRCVLKVDRNKGLGFVLSATGDYDHTITAVEKVRSSNNRFFSLEISVLFFVSFRQLIFLVYKSMMKYSKSMVLMWEMSNMNKYVSSICLY